MLAEPTQKNVTRAVHSTKAILALADGTLFHGKSIGVAGQTVGEVIFNTAMTGYQEILSDPSYSRQIITLTYPHIGNTGTVSEDNESHQVWAAGLAIKDLSLLTSNWRSTHSLKEYLHQHNVIAIADIDTRKLTRILREKGAQHACIMAGHIDADKAIDAAKKFPGLQNCDLTKIVSTKSKYTWQQKSWDPTLGCIDALTQALPYHVVVYDFGVKRNILRLLVDRGCRLTVVPAQTPAAEVLALKPDGIFLSNGPGDPAACDYAITNIQSFLKTSIPIFGICLGHQLLALACGAKTGKMKFGHHGANHPVHDYLLNTVLISSQNHGFAVEEKNLPTSIEVTHRSLFDGTIQGIRCKDKPAFSFQGHPEASPGPHDVGGLFDHFIELIKSYGKA